MTSEQSYWRDPRQAAGGGQKEAAAPPPGLFDAPLRRRDFLGLLALGGLAACRPPLETILPYDVQPDETTPGLPLSFATTLTLGGFGRGALVRCHEGRPTKVEGNPSHPDSLGAADHFMQAAILDLYDPDRSRAVLERGRASSWEALRRALAAALERERPRAGAGLRLLTGAATSPTLAAQAAELRRAFPGLRWHVHEPAAGNEAAGARLAFGVERSVRYDLSAADALVCLGADLLFAAPGSLAYARAFADRRDPDGPRPTLRVHAAEPWVSVTGANADRRLSAPPSRFGPLLAAIARELGVELEAPELSPRELAWAQAAARDLRGAGPRGLLVCGASLEPELHALGHALNARLGSAGRAAVCADPILSAGDSSLGELCRDMAAGEVSLLLMLGVNPAYSAPPGAGFAEALARVPFSLHLGLHADETAELCAWHAPMAHPFEAWGDARAFDGTASIQQPLIAPLYGGASAHELLSSASGHEAVRGFWAARGVAGSAWDSAVREGVIPGTRYPARPTPIAAAWRPPRLAAERPSLELCLRPSPAVRDGGAANNPWLQELPDPVTKLTWGDAALLSPRLAARLGVANGDVLALSVEERSLEAPAWVVAGQADETVTLSLGYGRRRGGRWAEGTGASAYVLRSRDGEWRRSGLAARPTGGRRELPCTQGSQEMEGRDLIREGALARGDEENPPPSLYPPMPGGEHAWGMSIDLARCIGCNACVVACQAENNVPWVGPEEVRRGRHMHWLRVDRYYKGDPAEPAGMAFQPVPCMHCEHAPCEEVCPVGATVHSPEGLNEMVYNRCVGTRYCSNNCPYKVRRFNFFRFSTDDAVAQLAANPDVSVRERGVMEKCTYCVQRIQGVRVAAEKEGRPIADGEVITACQAACPSRAIVFGDLRDPKSAVLALRKSPRSYGLLSELGTRPRTTYLARGPA